MSEVRRYTPRLFERGAWGEARRVAGVLRRETIGGGLLLGGASIAVVWANSPWAGAYEALRGFRVGPASLHLDLTLATWAADGLLAVFFFVAGLELKREFVAGDLRDPWRAAVPVAAAFGGMLVPAALYLLIAAGSGDGAAAGWAIPAATDIAFALAVLAVIGRHLPSALRTFLLALAVVDDLIAIVIIALFYTEQLSPLPLLVALAPLGAFAALVRRGVRSWWLLLPLAAVTWALVHASGVHATVAGVLLALTVPAIGGLVRGDGGASRDGGPAPVPPKPRRGVSDLLPVGGSTASMAASVADRPGEEEGGLAEHFEHRFRPLSAGVAVPVFALLSAGVVIGGLEGLAGVFTEPVALGVVVGLVVGKPVGVLAATWLVARFTRAGLDEGLRWLDVAGLSVLAGMGFTVSLLIGELSFGAGDPRAAGVKMAVVTGSLIAALLAAVILALRNRVYRRVAEAEAADSDGDGVPDVYQSPDGDRPHDHR
ncbi:Na+/H+ antiporter NhaA [Sphaerisporangium sp. TRM90804]|uniref:Na+/H+ antiporter NhaA n=1 Tax=Sphaerisporangium sp. TRM90804 TaxID=3031113 RepID=UPI00244C61D4|nr:Na+/H+ antiporter NhaA [Sphaerisporangium sp. TRM90804]MDH2430215.1 Na+/H+ antiporter NhaA [Sphaerisporangium sp. TRM90804]